MRLFSKSALCLAALIFVATPQQSEAITLSVDTYLEGDASIIPFLPAGTIDINDVGAGVVRFDLTPTLAGLKYDNLGLGLDSSINESLLVLAAITPDSMSLDTGGWLGFPFKINFDDKPMTPVSFTLSAPGLDVTDFLHLPASIHYPLTNFALRFWFMTSSSGGPIDATAGNNTAIPEPATLLLLGSGLVAVALRRRA